jgi:purine-binding chemotaxis protein CheW
MTESNFSERTADLRRNFDQSFAAPIQADTRETIDFISIRLGGDAHAIRMTEIAGLFADVRITPCPSPIRELRGLAGFRGALTPVYDLALLLGYPMSSARWMVLTEGRTLALAFDEFDGHFRVEPAAVASQQGSSSSPLVRAIAQQADLAWPVIDIPTVVAAITARAAAASSHKEH